ncbi:MAG: VPLPA-CTERM sorting domain-containing protein [Pseudomonadota bacterium]
MNTTRRFLVALAMACALTGAGAMQAMAANIFLSGDSNIANPLTGNGTSVNPGNQQFFRNILGSATNVVLLNTSVPFIQAPNNISFFYSSLPGVSTSIINGTVSTASLAGSQLFVVTVPEDAFSASELSAIVSYVAAGNSVFFLGENNDSSFDVGNNAINAALAALGSSMSIVKALFDAGFNPTTIGVDPLTAGVLSMVHAAPSRVSGGTQILFGTGAEPFFAYETVGTSVVPVPASLPLLVGGLGMIGLALRRRAVR